MLRTLSRKDEMFMHRWIRDFHFSRKQAYTNITTFFKFEIICKYLSPHNDNIE